MLALTKTRSRVLVKSCSVGFVLELPTSSAAQNQAHLLMIRRAMKRRQLAQSRAIMMMTTKLLMTMMIGQLQGTPVASTAWKGTALMRIQRLASVTSWSLTNVPVQATFVVVQRPVNRRVLAMMPPTTLTTVQPLTTMLMMMMMMMMMMILFQATPVASMVRREVALT